MSPRSDSLDQDTLKLGGLLEGNEMRRALEDDEADRKNKPPIRLGVR